MAGSHLQRQSRTRQVQGKKAICITIFKTCISMAAATESSHVSDSPSAISKESMECKQPPKNAVLTFLFTKEQH